MTSRKLIIAASLFQVFAAIASLAVNELVEVGKYNMLRPVAIAQHEGGDPTAEAVKVVTKLSAQYHYPALAFGAVSAAAAFVVLFAVVRRSK